MVTTSSPRLVLAVFAVCAIVLCLYSVQRPARPVPSRAASAQPGLRAIDWDANAAGTWKTGWRRHRVGSVEWKKLYPPYEHGPAPRQDWLDLLYAAKREGLIADVPKATLEGGLAVYPDDVWMDSTVCSYRRSTCFAADDIVDGPRGTWAINYDDGPLPPSKTLHTFLDSQNEHATYFWVGHNVLENWQLALDAAERGDHLAVHTWSHPHLTTYTDEQIIGELGWTMQIIYDISGHVPKYLRPPFGDTDARVRSLARLLGLTTVIWNDDSDDWALNQIHAKGDYIDPPYDITTQHSIDRLTNRMNGSKEIGIIFLEHELSEESVDAFVQSYPVLAERGWRTGPIPQLMELPWYQ